MNAPSTRRRRFPWFGWLAVIFLWGMIMWVLLPVFTGLPEPGQRPSCSNNLHQLGLALGSYQSDWDDKLMPLRTLRQRAPEGRGWPDRIRQYVKVERVLTCIKAPEGYPTYAFNRRLSGAQSGPSSVYLPADAVLVYDSVNDRPEFNNLNGDTVWHYQDGGMPQPGQYVPWDGPVEVYTRGWPKWAKPRHLNGNSVLFADGHVKWMEPTDIPRFDPKSKEE